MNDPSRERTLQDKKEAGVGLHLTSLPGAYGIGEIGGSARRFVDRLAAMGIGVWQFLPTGPTAYGDSPYQPLSSFAGNENLIDLEDLVRLGLLTRTEVLPLRELPRGSVDYGSLTPLKQALLLMAARRFEQRAPAELQAALDTFIDANDANWLHDYALFRILKSAHQERPWPEWADEFVHRDDRALRKLAADDAQKLKAIKIIQFLFFRQWKTLREYAHANRVRLFGDMPIYIALDSADAWSNRDILRLDDSGRPDAVAGVPPDYFSDTGQLWGNPLYDWPKHVDQGFKWWIDRIRATAELADMVRIDHFRGFESYWAVPASAETAKDGHWEPGVGDALFDALKRAIGTLPIVAENLGVITPEVEALRVRFNLPGMHVLQFDVCDPDFDLNGIDENEVCYTGTHDNDTTLGWFRGSPDDIRSEEEIQRTRQMALDVTSGTPETIHIDMIRAAFSTPARLAVAPLQDYLGLGSEARMNVPGTSNNNWRWRVEDAQLTPEVCDNIGELVGAAGRGIK